MKRSKQKNQLLESIESLTRKVLKREVVKNEKAKAYKYQPGTYIPGSWNDTAIKDDTGKTTGAYVVKNNSNIVAANIIQSVDKMTDIEKSTAKTNKLNSNSNINLNKTYEVTSNGILKNNSINVISIISNNFSVLFPKASDKNSRDFMFKFTTAIDCEKINWKSQDDTPMSFESDDNDVFLIEPGKTYIMRFIETNINTFLVEKKTIIKIKSPIHM